MTIMPQPPQRSQNVQQTPTLDAPRNSAELEVLMRQRGELGSQLESVTERRRELTEQMQATGLTGRGDLQARLKGMDDRAARLENQIMRADDAIADALARGVVVDRRPNAAEQLIQRAMTEAPSRNEIVRDSVVQALALEGVLFVLLGLAFWRFMWKPALAKLTRPASDSARIDQLQQAVDVIAVEVERISEGQRYVTKLLDEKLRGIGAGEAQHIPAMRQAAAPVRTSGESP
jgi:hypothetical protein